MTLISGMVASAIHRLAYLVDIATPLLMQIGEPAFSLKPSPGQWSKKEIIGHLIDSAANNHQRFIRGQFEDDPSIAYDQDNWNRYSYHQQIDGRQIIAFWTSYNRQLIEIMRYIPKESLGRTVTVEGEHLTLGFLVEDYVAHLEHHLRQVISYPDTDDRI